MERGLGLVKPWPGTLPVMSPLPPLARGATVGHTGSHAVRIRTLLNVHVHMTRATRRKQLSIAALAVSSLTIGRILDS